MQFGTLTRYFVRVLICRYGFEQTNFFIFFLCLLLSGFVEAHEVGFFFLKDKSINAVSASAMSINEIELEVFPFWTIDSFEEYRCPSHEFKLTAKATAAIPKIDDVRGVPFVLRISGKNIYLGAFFSGFSNEIFRNPVIENTFPAPIGKIWKLYRAYPHDGFGQGVDPRPVFEFMNELKTKGTLIEECLTR